MKPNSEQCDVYRLHLEIKDQGAKAMDHTQHAHIQRSRNPNDSARDWAIDYGLCLPHNIDQLKVVHYAHMDHVENLSSWAEKVLDWFYEKLYKRGVYQAGAVWLKRKNGNG